MSLVRQPRAVERYVEHAGAAAATPPIVLDPGPPLVTPPPPVPIPGIPAIPAAPRERPAGRAMTV
jgi:hypothetical protein